MPEIGRDQRISSSLLDRLLPVPADRTSTDLRTQNVAELRKSIWTDLRNLLNTRWPIKVWPPELTELERSLANYGIPDFVGLNLSSRQTREELREQIERAIRCFEPRFASVEVQLQDNKDSIDRTLRLKITARVYAEPMPISIGFEPVVDPLSNLIELRGNS